MASTALHVLTNECRCVFRDNTFKIIGILFYWIFGISEFSSVKARGLGDGDIIRFFIVFIPLVGTDLHAFTSNSMIGSIKANNSSFIGMKFCHLHCEIVGF